jgi:uncharacterized lipoprotein YajG
MSARGGLRLIVVLLAVALAACGYKVQTVEFQPQVTTPASNAGAGRTLSLSVVDDRPDITIGYRQGSLGRTAGAIRTDQDLPEVVRAAIADGLSRMQFRVVPLGQPADASLKVELRQLEYQSSSGVLTEGAHARSALKATAVRRPGAAGTAYLYERLYRAESEMQSVLPPTASDNRALLNAILSTTIQQLLDDPELIGFLAGR